MSRVLISLLYPRKQKTPMQTMSIDIVRAMTATTPMVTTAVHKPHDIIQMHMLL